LIRFLALYRVADLLLPPPRLEDIFMGYYDQHAGQPRERDGQGNPFVGEASPADDEEARAFAVAGR
jgi:hypothetical protein